MKPHDKREHTLEEQLRRALRQREAPPGFADRVLVRVQQQDSREPWWTRWFAGINVRAVQFATVIVVLTAVLVGSLEYRRYARERQQGEAAKQQLMLALRIASQKWQYAQAKVNRTGSRQQAPAQQDQEQQ